MPSASDGTNFVAVGTNSTVLLQPRTSLAGIISGLAWTKESLATTNILNLAAVTYGNGRYVLGGQNALVFSSRNYGTSWPAQTKFTPLFKPYEVGGLAFNGGTSGILRRSPRLLKSTWECQSGDAMAAYHE